MKCLLIYIIFFVIYVNSDINKRLLLPQLSVGKYRLNFLGMTRCVSIQSNNNKLKFDLYLSKKSANTTEIKGNITSSVALNDFLNLEFNMAIKDSIGGWKENAHVYKSPRACSSLRMFLGDAWTPFMDNFGIHNATCPIPVGFYKAAGVDTEIFNISNFPKTFFYGTYKFRYSLTKNNEVYGCFILVVEVKRPWETNN